MERIPKTTMHAFRNDLQHLRMDRHNFLCLFFTTIIILISSLSIKYSWVDVTDKIHRNLTNASSALILPSQAWAVEQSEDESIHKQNSSKSRSMCHVFRVFLFIHPDQLQSICWFLLLSSIVWFSQMVHVINNDPVTFFHLFHSQAINVTVGVLLSSAFKTTNLPLPLLPQNNDCTKGKRNRNGKRSTPKWNFEELNRRGKISNTLKPLTVSLRRII